MLGEGRLLKGRKSLERGVREKNEPSIKGPVGRV